MAENWWDAAPRVDRPSRGGQWWEAAPTLDETLPAAPDFTNVRSGASSVPGAPADPEPIGFWRAMLERARAGLTSTVGGGVQALGESLARPYRPLRQTALAPLAEQLGQPYESLAATGAEIVGDADVYRQIGMQGVTAPGSLGDVLADPGNAARYWGGIIAESTPTMLAAMATRNPSAAAAVAGAGAGAQQYGGARAEGRTHEEAMREAQQNALIEGALSTLPFEAALGGASIPRRLATVPLLEGTTESVAEGGQTLATAATRGERVSQDELGRAMLDAFVAGTGMGVGEAVLGRGPSGQPQVAPPAAPQPAALPAAPPAPLGDALAPAPRPEPEAPRAAPPRPRQEAPPPDDIDTLLLRNIPPAEPAQAQGGEPSEGAGRSRPTPAPPAPAAERQPTMQNRDRGRAASVAQMQDIRRNPDPARLGFSRDANTGAPMVSRGQDIPAQDLGRTDAVVMPDGRRVPVQYAVVEADAVQASHDADGNVNPAYDAAPLKALNNGRTAGLQAAWRAGNAAAYRDGIAADADFHGVPAEAIASKRQPVLVRLYDPAENLSGAESNASQQLGLSPVEQAQTDASLLPDLSGIQWAEDGSLNPGANANFFRAWFRNMGETQAATLQDAQGRPNAAALQRVRAAMVQRAYGDERLLTALVEDTNPDNRNVMNALVQAAPAFASLDEGNAVGRDIRAALTGGLQMLRDASARGISLTDAIAQQDMFGRNADADAAAQYMAANARSAKRMAEAFRALAEYASQAEQQAATLDVFGTAPTPTVRAGMQRAGMIEGEANGRVELHEGAPVRDREGQPREQAPGRAAAGDARVREGDGIRVAEEQPGFFPEPTRREEVDAERRRRDAERDGRTGTGRTDMAAGPGDLFAGPRPAQATIPERRTRPEHRVDARNAPRDDGETGGSDLESIARRMGDADADRLGLRETVEKALGKAGERVIYIRDYQGLPERLRRAVEQRLEQRGGKGRPSALYDPRTQRVYVYTSVNNTPAKALRSAAHEIAGHHGLRTLLGDRLDHALNIALQNPTVKAVADAIAEQRKLRGDQRLLAAEEALAELAAVTRTGDYDLIRRAYGVEVPAGMRASVKRAVDNFLRRLKAMVDDIFGRHVFSDEDVRDLLEAAWQAVDGGQTLSMVEANGRAAFESVDGSDAVGGDQTQTPGILREGDDIIPYVATDDSVAGGQGARAAGGDSRRSANVDEVTGLPMNGDGTVTVYHHTSADRAESIRRDGLLRADAEPDVYVTTRAETDTGYGDTAVPIRVDPARLELDDEFPNGRRDFRINVGRPGGSIRVRVENDPTALDSPGAPRVEASRDMFVPTRGDRTLQGRIEEPQDQTQTPEFRRWFGDSKVVDEQGRPLVVYRALIGEVRDGFDGGSFFAYDRGVAEAYADDGDHNVGEFYLSLQNPLALSTPEAVARAWDESGGRDAPRFHGGEDSAQKRLRDWAEAQGYDGIMVTPEAFEGEDGYREAGGTFGEPQIIAFRPEQIKSATGNRGTFDPDNPSILESVDLTPEQQDFMRKAGLAPDTRTTRQKMLDWARGVLPDIQKDSLIAGTLDAYYGLKQAVQRKGGATVETDPYIAARMINIASTMEAILRFGAPKMEGGALRVNRDVPGLFDALKPVQDNLPGFFGWMVARRAKLLKEQGREQLMSDADIQAGLSLRNGHEAAFDEAARNYLRLKNAILDFAEQHGGTIDPAARAAWDHAEYIPFYREDGEGGVAGPGTKRGLTHQSAGIRRLKGGEQNLRDPLANIIQNFTRLMDSALKNRAMQLAVDQLGDTYFKKVPPKMAPSIIPLDQVKKHLLAQGVDQATIDAMPQAALKGVAKMLTIEAPTGDNVVRVMREGKPEYYEVEDPLLLRALTAFNENPTPAWMKPLVLMKNLLTAGATSTPDFLIRNAIRDTGEAAVTAREHFIPIIDTAKGAIESAMMDDFAQDLMMAGSYFHGGLFHQGQYEATSRAIKRALRRHGMGEGKAERFVKTLANPKRMWDLYRAGIEATEMGSRVALARNRMKATGSFLEGAFEAKDFLDFTLKGDAALLQFFTRVIPFLNARLQGAYRLARAGTAKDRRRRVLARMAVMALASTALYAWNMLMHRDAYDDLEEWDKDAYWHFAPGTDYHIRLPKPFELGLLAGTAVERATAALVHAVTGGEAGDRSDQTLAALLHGITDTLAINPVPQAFKPAAEVYFNYNTFSDRPIESRGDEFLPPSERKTPHTSDFAAWVSGVLEGAVGEENALSPKQLQHLWRGYTGGMGMYLLNAADAGTRWLEGAPPKPESRLRDMPGIGALYRSGQHHTSRWVDEFYDLREVAQTQSNKVKSAMETGEPGRARNLEAEYGWLLGSREESKRAKGGFMHSGVRAIERAGREMAQLRKADRQIYESREMSPAEKRRRLDENARRRNEIAREMVRKLRARERERGR